MDLFKDLLRLLLFVPVVWLVFYLTTLIHEAGHLIAYLLGTKSWHIKVGRGKQLMRIGRVTFHLNPLVRLAVLFGREKKLCRRKKR